MVGAPAESGVRVVGHTHHVGVKGATQAGLGPTIECVKQGDKVARIIVTCACGERIEIECLYPAGG
jgi:hypothetical protein